MAGYFDYLPFLEGPPPEIAQMGEHANWDKFLAEARRSTNVEDNRQGQIYQMPWWRALFGEVTHK